MSTNDDSEPKQSGSILVVDDQEKIRRLLQRRLQQEGYQVYVAEDGGEALNFLQSNEVDLILLDIMMPDSDGYTVLRSIRQTYDPEELPVIMSTAKSESEDRVEAFEHGANDYITKPIDFPVVRARIKTHLSLKQAHDRIQKLAREDELTGLYNRRHWMSLYEKEFNRTLRYENDLSVLILDLDKFSDINDTYGHLAGDQILREVAELLDETTRDPDVIGRYGGEEFGLFLPETGHEPAVELAERIRRTVEEHEFEYDGATIECTVSIGVAELWSGRDDKTSLLNKADQALYEAKRSGRNRVDRRRFERISVDDLPVVLESEEQTLEGGIVNCSKVGLSVDKISEDLDVDDVYRLDVPEGLPEEIDPSDKVNVRWTTPSDRSGYLVGLEFVK